MVAFVCVFICHTIAIKIPRSSGHFADYQKKRNLPKFSYPKNPKIVNFKPKKILCNSTSHEIWSTHLGVLLTSWAWFIPKKASYIVCFPKKMAIYCIWNEKKILMPLHCHYLWQCFLQNALIIFLEKLSWPEYIIIFYRGFQTLWLG